MSLLPISRRVPVERFYQTDSAEEPVKDRRDTRSHLWTNFVYDPYHPVALPKELFGVVLYCVSAVQCYYFSACVYCRSLEYSWSGV